MDVQPQQGLVSKTTGSGAARDPVLAPQTERRRFGGAYKARILVDVDKSPGQTGVILRRERLRSSHLTNRREQRHTGPLEGLRYKRGSNGSWSAVWKASKLFVR